MQGVINSGQLQIARARQKDGTDSKLPIGAILIKLGFAKEEDITRARAIQMGIGYAGPDLLSQCNELGPEITGTIQGDVALHFGLLPIGRSDDGKCLRIISSNWTQASYDAARKLTTDLALGVEALLASERYVRPALQQYYGTRSSVPATVDERKALPAKRPAQNIQKASDLLTAARRTTVAESGPGADIGRMGMETADLDIQEVSVDQPLVIQFVNKIIKAAIEKRASDIHLEPLRDCLEVKYRVDGALHQADTVGRQYQNACVSRIKVMADMNIAERRVPQDGRITVTMDRRQVDLRVSSLPTQYGEAVVMRILDRSMMKLDIDHLGFGERNLRTLKNIVSKPHGIFLATGPTGSGKTTTLYAALQLIKSPDINIITVEDPIEYELDGVRQSNVNEKAGLSFAKQLRAILRQDPDVIYVGEIRDPETAEIAFRAALTGHLVFSTLHCNDAAGAVTRLLNMGMDPFLIASSVIGVLAQRLVRKVCVHCAREYEPRHEELAVLGINPDVESLQNARFLRGEGCSECDKTGYRGRYSVQELMMMDDSVRQLTLDRAPSTKIRTAAISSPTNPMIPMKRDGADKVISGITTFEEIQRRVFLEDE